MNALTRNRRTDIAICPCSRCVWDDAGLAPSVGGSLRCSALCGESFLETVERFAGQASLHLSCLATK